MKHPIERGTAGLLPYAAIGEGPPLLVFAGLSPDVGVDGDMSVRMSLGPFEALAATRRLVLFNRRANLPRGISFEQLASEHADAINAEFGGNADLIGISTGGSLAQQLAADHPDTVRRLVLASTGCRLQPNTKAMQRQIAARIRGGAPRKALAVGVAALVPPRRGQIPAAMVAYAFGPLLLRGHMDLDDMATTIEAEDSFDLAHCPPIAAPTLILAGADDRFYSHAVLEETADLIPGSELVMIERRGHITAMSDPRFREAVEQFLA